MKYSIGHVSSVARRFHINATLSVSEPVSSSGIVSSATSKLINAYQLPKLTSDNQLKLEPIGSSNSHAASVSLPPSLPVNIRRGLLLALQGDPAHVSIKPHFLSPLKRFLYGNLTSRYTQIISTDTTLLLVSARAETAMPRLFRVSSAKALASIVLDGKSDWALLKRDALHIYGGPSLNVETVKVPLRISRQLAKSLNSRTRLETGIFSWLRVGYTFVGGRGVIGVVGNGLIYSVDVAEGDEVAVSKSCLVGVSVNGPQDLQNSLVKLEQKPVHVPAIIMPPPRVALVKTWRDIVMNIKHYSWITAKALKDVWFWFRQHTSETPSFVKVIGPRTVLLQSGDSVDSYEKAFEVPSLESYGTVAPSVDVPIPRVAADYMNTVTVGPKGVTIDSTDSFVKK